MSDDDNETVPTAEEWETQAKLLRTVKAASAIAKIASRLRNATSMPVQIFFEENLQDVLVRQQIDEHLTSKGWETKWVTDDGDMSIIVKPKGWGLKKTDDRRRTAAPLPDTHERRSESPPAIDPFQLLE